MVRLHARVKKTKQYYAAKYYTMKGKRMLPTGRVGPSAMTATLYGGIEGATKDR